MLPERRSLAIWPLSRGAGQPVHPFLVSIEHGVGRRPRQRLSGFPDLGLLGQDPEAGTLAQLGT